MIKEGEIPKGFYFIVNQDGKVIDAANIYAFDHEDVFTKRISLKINAEFDGQLIQR